MMFFLTSVLVNFVTLYSLYIVTVLIMVDDIYMHMVLAGIIPSFFIASLSSSVSVLFVPRQLGLFSSLGMSLVIFGVLMSM